LALRQATRAIAFKEWGILGSHSQSYTSPPEVETGRRQVEAHHQGQRRREAITGKATKRVLEERRLRVQEC